MKPPMTTKYTTIINIIFNIFIKTVGSSVIFSSFCNWNIAQKFIKSIKIGHIWQMKNYIIFDIDRQNTHDKSILLYA